MTLTSNPHDFELMFESAPISLWLEDYSALKRLFDRWRAEGVTDLDAHLQADPQRIAECSRCYRIIKVNQQTLRLLGASSQQELEARLHEVFRGDMLTSMLGELRYLWSGVLDFATQTVNYTLDGRRMDVVLRVRVLSGHEDRWDRVMVSLADISERAREQERLRLSEERARDLFAFSPVSLWVLDFSQLREDFAVLRRDGITDLAAHLAAHPEFTLQCMDRMRVLDVNQQTLDLFAATSREELLQRLPETHHPRSQEAMAAQLLGLWNGQSVITHEMVHLNLHGEEVHSHLQLAILPEHRERWDLVLVSMTDITARKKSEAYLEYLGNHDALTHLRNRAFFNEELKRIQRQGPWPLGVVAIDMNGLKAINDAEGHAAGDELLRRAAEVLSKATLDQPCCLARTGGDEFVALMPGASLQEAREYSERVQALLELNNQFYPGRKLNLAIGVASCTHAQAVDQALHEADQAMYSAKKQFYEARQADRRRR